MRHRVLILAALVLAGTASAQAPTCKTSTAAGKATVTCTFAAPAPIHDTIVKTVHDTVIVGAAPVAPAPIPPPILSPAPTPPSNPGVCANEPAGYTRIEDQPWNTAVPAKWIDDARDFLSTGKGTIVSDPTAPLSPSSVVAGLFPNGSPGGSGPFYIYRPFAATEQYKNLYICIIAKHSTDFDNSNGNAGTKFLWPAGDQVQGTGTYFTFNGSSMDFGVNQQGGNSNNREMYANLGASGTVYSKRGQWVRYEVLMKANTDNNSPNGQLHIWINGVKTHQYTDVNWQMASARTWLSLAWNPTYGGGLNPVPHNQYEYIDHLRISGATP